MLTEQFYKHFIGICYLRVYGFVYGFVYGIGVLSEIKPFCK